MTDQNGQFIWFELMTPDPDGAAAFYAQVVGWRAKAFGGPAGPETASYSIFHAADGDGIAGLIRTPDECAGQPPQWFGYVGVADPDASVAAATAAGAAVHVAPTDIPGVGRFAFLADPGGASFYVMRGDSPEASEAFRPGAQGHGCWTELVADDQDAAIAFYAGLFGWTKDGGMPMGAMGDYSFLKRGNAAEGEFAFGAAMNRQPGDQVGWRYYFQRDGVAAAADRIAAAGGTVLHGPAEVPGGSHIVIAADPQGAVFGLVGSREDGA